MYKIPENLSNEDVLFLADILPTAFEVGVLNGRVQPGDTVAVIGAGPVGLAAMMTAKLFTPEKIIAIDLADSRLASALDFGADTALHSDESVREHIMELTDNKGVDVAIEAVGVPQTFELACDIVTAGGHVANIGVHGRAATLHLETLWTHDVTITTGLVDTFTIPQLMRLVSSGHLDPSPFATHYYLLEDTLDAYDDFANAAATAALKVVLDPNLIKIGCLTEKQSQAVAV